MSKLNEAAITPPSTPDVLKNAKTEGKGAEKEETKENKVSTSLFSSNTFGNEKINSKCEDDSKEILRFTMLFNKYNLDLDLKGSWRSNTEAYEKHKRDVKYTMFFNKEVTIRSNAETSSNKSQKSGNFESEPQQNSVLKNNCSKSTQMLRLHKPEFGRPQISEPDMMFSSSLTSSSPEVFEKKLSTTVPRNGETENQYKLLSKRSLKVENDSLIQLNVHPAMRTNLRIHSSLTCLSKNNKLGLKGMLKSKIPSLTAIDTNSMAPKSGSNKFSYWDHLDDLFLMQDDFDNKRLSLQISKSSNDNNRRSAIKLKKDEGASVSDSKLLFTDFETKKHIKKCDKKSRGDSLRKERENCGRKQVQWKTEVDVIYFSTHLAANGDRTGEVIGRVMEPLREEWEQQRKGFYVPYHMESHLKDRFISLLKI